MSTQIQKTVLFYGDELIAVQMEDSGSIYVPLPRLCDNLGIERKRQAQRIRDHEVLSVVAGTTGCGELRTRADVFAVSP